MKKLWIGLITACLLPIFAQAETTPVELPEQWVEFLSYEDANLDESETEPVRRRRFACYAENRRRQLFRAIGYFPRRTQRMAMRLCFRYSYECRPLGCRRIW